MSACTESYYTTNYNFCLLITYIISVWPPQLDNISPKKLYKCEIIFGSMLYQARQRLCQIIFLISMVKNYLPMLMKAFLFQLTYIYIYRGTILFMYLPILKYLDYCEIIDILPNYIMYLDNCTPFVN